MLAAARVTLKLHRFEVGAGALAALAIGVSALIVEYRLRALNVPVECIDNWLARADGPDGAGPCVGPMHAWGEILGVEGGLIFGVMKYLPFAIGLLAGVPIVARELEARTAQTAWSLSGSRWRWLMRQLAPVLILLGVTVTFAALAASVLEANNVAWGGLFYAYFDLGMHGPLVVARAFGAFGIGLLIGALLGRTLPAFVLGAALSLALVVAVGTARDTWLARLDPVVIGASTPPGGDVVFDHQAMVVQSGWGWRAPDGTQLTFEEGLARVPREIFDHDDRVQYINSSAWLFEHGYASLALGVTAEQALGWAPYDALIFGLVGTASIAGTIVVVNRRRPS
jgi:hypothetical protein